MKFRLYFFLMALVPQFLLAQKVISITIDGPINPVTADHIRDGIQKTEEMRAECLIIHLNTPGGLLKSTRKIVTELLESSVPVVVFVSPEGAHAGSAGVFITMAAHFAAMAPATNIGAAHPVSFRQMDSVMNEKATNDAAAFIRSIATKRNRNLKWAEQAVRSSTSITATEALVNKVIDYIAVSDKDLLEELDGKKVQLNKGVVVLRTKGASVEKLEMSAIEKFLDLLSDPNIAYILMMLGIYGLMFELYSPGTILPGVVGVIALVLAFYSMHTLPINYAGLALIIFGIILFILEVKIISHGLLAIGGAASLLLGSMMLIRAGSSLEFVRISRAVILSVTAVTAAFFLFVVGAGIRAQRRSVVSGKEGLVGAIATARSELAPNGMVWVNGELWKAVSTSGNIEKGEKLSVTGMKNLTLYVERITTT
jgi:membrane-bound serine protease (ClpP class)